MKHLDPIEIARSVVTVDRFGAVEIDVDLLAERLQHIGYRRSSDALWVEVGRIGGATPLAAWIGRMRPGQLELFDNL